MGRLARAWALIGVALLFFFAIQRLGSRGIDTLAAGLTPFQWGILALSLFVFGYGEGVLALERRWVPRLIHRANELALECKPFYRWVARLYVMSLVGAAKREMIRSWSLVLAILGAVVLVGRLPVPWRGIIDLGVAAALAWGLVAIARAARPLKQTGN